MNEPQVTVLYYTSNREVEPFASRVREWLLRNKGDLPLISVSQKPLENFGHNICVGEQDSCYANEFRQIQIGLKEVKTPYVLHAEADFIYPPEYFTFIPKVPGNYRYNNVWVLHTNNRKFPLYYFKQRSVGAELNDTQQWLERLNSYLRNRDEWSTRDNDSTLSKRVTFPDSDVNVWTGRPVITFKASGGINKYTQCPKGYAPVKKLEYWGSADRVRRKMTR